MRRVKMSTVQLDDPLTPDEPSPEGPPPPVARAARAMVGATCLVVVLAASILGATSRPATTPAPSPGQSAQAPLDACPGDHMRSSASSCLGPCGRYVHMPPPVDVACEDAQRVTAGASPARPKVRGAGPLATPHPA